MVSHSSDWTSDTSSLSSLQRRPKNHAIHEERLALYGRLCDRHKIPTTLSEKMGRGNFQRKRSLRADMADMATECIPSHGCHQSNKAVGPWTIVRKESLAFTFAASSDRSTKKSEHPGSYHEPRNGAN